MKYQYFTKRAIDISLSFLGIMIASPILVVIFILLRLTQKGSPFFLQNRPGKNQLPFCIIKFRTMRDPYDRKGNLLKAKDRITFIGQFLRRYSLDEIPQLFNVLKGDMSIVGPRPLLMDYLSLYNDDQRRRHDVKPGITGWAQINGRNAISWEEKFKYDVYYVKHLSFGFDMKIIGLTFLKVIRKEGINQCDESPMQAFLGTQQDYPIKQKDIPLNKER